LLPVDTTGTDADAACTTVVDAAAAAAAISCSRTAVRKYSTSSRAASNLDCSVLQLSQGLLSTGKNEGGNSLRPPPKAGGADMADGDASVLMDDAEWCNLEWREVRIGSDVSGMGVDVGRGGVEAAAEMLRQ
jgi:hypothetical protein